MKGSITLLGPEVNHGSSLKEQGDDLLIALDSCIPQRSGSSPTTSILLKLNYTILLFIFVISNNMIFLVFLYIFFYFLFFSVVYFVIMHFLSLLF